jgi:hypothetical protein
VIQTVLQKSNKTSPSVSTGGLFNIGWLDLQQALASTKYPQIAFEISTNLPKLCKGYYTLHKYQDRHFGIVGLKL